jgi:hypothetical protein
MKVPATTVQISAPNAFNTIFTKAPVALGGLTCIGTLPLLKSPQFYRLHMSKLHKDGFCQPVSKNARPKAFYPHFRCLNGSLCHFSPYVQDFNSDFLRPFQLSERPRMWNCACFCYRNELATPCYLICHPKGFVNLLLRDMIVVFTCLYFSPA